VRGNRYYRGRDAQQKNIIHRRNNLLVYTLVGENTNKGGGHKLVGLYTLVGDNTNKGGGQKLVSLYTLVGDNTNKGGGQKLVGLYSCW
jgi:hypothetical protein